MLRSTLFLLSMLCCAAAFCCFPVHAAERDPRQPAAIETQSVPAVPAAISEALAQYQSMRTATFSGWAPDGRGMLIRTRFADASQLHRVYEPGGRREQVTFFAEPVRGTFIEGAQDGAMILSMSRGGDENYQLYLLDPQRFSTLRLTDGKSRNDLGPFSPDGKRMVVRSNRRNGRDTDIYTADCRRADSLKLAYQVDGEYWYAWDWSRDGARLSMEQYVSINESYPALLDINSGKLTRLPVPKSDKAAYSNLRFSPDGKQVYLTTDVRGEFRQLVVFDLETEQYRWLTDDIKWDVRNVQVEHQSGDVALTVNDNGASRLYVIGEQGRKGLKTPLGIIANLEFSPDGKHLGFSLFRPNAPGDAYSIELATGKLIRWTYSELGGLDPQKFVSPRRIEFPSFDGRKIPAYYFRPPAASKEHPAAVLINIHGGPEGQYRPYFNSSDQFYAGRMGIAVIWPNVRGSAGYGKTYLKLDNGPLRENSVRDIGALLDWIAEQPELDANRVAVAGGSYGGYMVLGSLTHYSDRLTAGIDRVGIANFITFLERTKPYRQDLRRAEYGDERDPKMRALFNKINPTSNAEKIDAALLVSHGTNDPRVPFFEAKQIAEKVRSLGRQVWTVYADNEGHGFAKRANRDYLRAVEAMFLERYLLGK